MGTAFFYLQPEKRLIVLMSSNHQEDVMCSDMDMVITCRDNFDGI